MWNWAAAPSAGENNTQAIKSPHGYCSIHVRQVLVSQFNFDKLPVYCSEFVSESFCPLVVTMILVKWFDSSYSFSSSISYSSHFLLFRYHFRFLFLCSSFLFSSLSSSPCSPSPLSLSIFPIFSFQVFAATLASGCNARLEAESPLGAASSHVFFFFYMLSSSSSICLPPLLLLLHQLFFLLSFF